MTITGVGDPSGRGEGFAYVREPMQERAVGFCAAIALLPACNVSPSSSCPLPQLLPPKKKAKTPDLRKLTMHDMSKILINFGYTEQRVNRLE